MNLLIVGAGLSGAIIAHKAAEAGKKVLILEKRPNVGGNIYDYREKNTQLVQKYGPHIWHTDNKRANDFMAQFWELNDYKNRVEGMIKGSLIPIPFNFVGIEKFWPEKAEVLKEKLIAKYGKDNRVSILKLLNQEDEDLQMVANFVYKNVFENYTTKMWGKDPSEIDQSVVNRVPVVIGYQDRYFSNEFEGIPKGGFTSAIMKMLDHPNIEVRTNVEAKKVLRKASGKFIFEGKEVICPIIYTGQIDELFDRQFGILSYRSLHFNFELLKTNHYQKTAVVNYPDDKDMTRITEYKNFYGESVEGTVISREYPGQYVPEDKRFNTPYYPMATDEAREQYAKYKQLADQYPNLHLVGRLATYKYNNMDQTVDLALAKWEELK